MLQFPIPPDYCLIINAFSQASTLRGAAQILGTDPSSLVRKVQKLSAEHGYLQKIGNRWALTEAGTRVAQWTDEIINSQKKIKEDKPRLRIAAFSWLVDEMVFPNFNKLNESFDSKYLWSIKVIASDLERELIQSRSDFVIHGHAPNDPSIAYKKIATYPWIVVAPYSWKKAVLNLSQSDLVAFLQTRPFVQLTTMNYERILSFEQAIMADIVADGVIAIRAAVNNNLGWSALPAMSVESFISERKILNLNLPTNIKDELSLWWLRSRKDNVGNVKPLVKWISEFKVTV